MPHSLENDRKDSIMMPEKVAQATVKLLVPYFSGWQDGSVPLDAAGWGKACALHRALRSRLHRNMDAEAGRVLKNFENRPIDEQAGFEAVLLSRIRHDPPLAYALAGILHG